MLSEPGSYFIYFARKPKFCVSTVAWKRQTGVYLSSSCLCFGSWCLFPSVSLLKHRIMMRLAPSHLAQKSDLLPNLCDYLIILKSPSMVSVCVCVCGPAVMCLCVYMCLYTLTSMLTSLLAAGFTHILAYKPIRSRISCPGRVTGGPALRFLMVRSHTHTHTLGAGLVLWPPGGGRGSLCCRLEQLRTFLPVSIQAESVLMSCKRDKDWGSD